MKVPDQLSRGADPPASPAGRCGHVWGRRVLDLIFPPQCVLCQDEFTESPARPAICPACRQQLVACPCRLCYHCGRPQPSDGPPGDSCPYCLREKNAFRRIFCLGPYQGTLRQAILRMKHLGQAPLAYAVGRLLAARILEAGVPLPATQLVPQPMHWRRRLLRGEGSAAVLAQALGDTLRLPVSRSLLVCQRRTEKQSLLSAAERRANVRGAFAIGHRHPPPHRHVALVDDTLTTGATANEAARVLRRAGASSVTVIVAARALEHEFRGCPAPAPHG